MQCTTEESAVIEFHLFSKKVTAKILAGGQIFRGFLGGSNFLKRFPRGGSNFFESENFRFLEENQGKIDFFLKKIKKNLQNFRLRRNWDLSSGAARHIKDFWKKSGFLKKIS